VTLDVEPGTGHDPHRIWAAVPYKGPNGAKRRLSTLLDADERSRLSLAMMIDVLAALIATPSIERVLVVTPVVGASDTAAVRFAEGRKAAALIADRRVTLLDEPPVDPCGEPVDGLNAALENAQTVASAAGASRLLIVPADVPLLQPIDVDALLNAGSAPAVVIAPDRGAGGTNALLLSPPSALTPSFGIDSFARHRLLAAQAGLACTVVARDGFALDLDTPADVAALLAADDASHTARLLGHLGVAERLERLALDQARNATI